MTKYLITVSTLAMLMAAPAYAAGDMTHKSAASSDAKVMSNDHAAAAKAKGNVQAKATQQQPGEIDSSKLIGEDIENSAGDDIGEVNSIILGQDGQVKAVIVGVGGFLGIGERDVAIDWNDLTVGKNGEEITANVTREQLEQMPEYQFANDQQRGTAFESDVAANKTMAPASGDRMAARPATPADTTGDAVRKTHSSDTAVTAKNDVGMKAKGAAASSSTMAAGDTGMKRADSDAAETKAKAANAQSMDKLGHMSADEVIGKDVVNLRGDDVGEVEDIVLGQDKAVFAVISVGGFLGMGDKNVAVPVKDLKVGDDDVIMMSESTEDQLKSMPAYDDSAYQPLDRSHTLGGDR